MKIALGMTFSGLNIGGVRRYIENIEKKSKHSISLFPSYENDQLWKMNYDMSIRHNYRNYIIKNEQSIIDQHDLFHSNVDPVFIRLCEKAQAQGKKWIHTYHSFYKDENEPDGRLKPWQTDINSALFNIAIKANIKISVSEWLVDYLQSLKINSVYIPNFIDIEKIEKYVKRDREKFILFIGDNAKNKNHSELLKVANKSSHKFVFIGTGLDNSISKNNTNIIGLGPLSHDLCLDYISRCSILVSCSYMEGLPTVLLEAMSFAKPCIIPDGPEWSKNLFKNSEGYRYKLGDINQLTSLIDTIMCNYHTIPEAKNYVFNNFSSDIVMKKIDYVYENIMKE